MINDAQGRLAQSGPSPSRGCLSRLRCWQPPWRLTLLGRSLLLFACEIAANALIWIVAGLLWGPDPAKRGVLSLAVIAWTLGLRHGLDMDHITVIDNVTRRLVALGRAPVTVGLFFSLGHSSLVVAVTVAIVVSVSTIDKLPDVASVGGVIGISVSASLLFLLAIINSVFLWQAIRARRTIGVSQHEAGSSMPVESQARDTEKDQHDADSPLERTPSLDKEKETHGLPAMTCIARTTRQLLKLVDQPWKLFPIGVVFSFGFDTSSEIALLGVSALAKSGSAAIPNGEIIILPLLFTAGMTFVDSCDSIFMTYAYTAPERVEAAEESSKPWRERLKLVERVSSEELQTPNINDAVQPTAQLATFSIALTVVSIVIALLISITEFMGLALEKCASCEDAAANDPGLSGNWWRFWGALNDNSGYLGAGVVGIFVLAVLGWLAVRQWRKRQLQAKKRERSSS